MKKVIKVLCTVCLVTLAGCEPKEPTETPSSTPTPAFSSLVNPKMVKDATTFSGTPFRPIKPGALPFEASFGPYGISARTVVPTHHATPEMMTNFLQKVTLLESDIADQLEAALVAQKEQIIQGQVTAQELLTPVAQEYANRIAGEFQKLHDGMFTHEHPPFALQVNDKFLWEVPDLSILGEVLHIADSMGYDIKSEARLAEMELPDPDPARIISIKLPYIAIQVLKFQEQVYTPDAATMKLVKSFLPAHLIETPTYLRIRITDDSLPGALTVTDRKNTIYYPPGKMMQDFAMILRDSSEVFPFAKLDQQKQTAILHRIHTMLLRHEQVHVMTRNVGLRNPKPTCPDCSDKELDGLMEAMAYIVAYVQSDNQTRYAITQLIQRGEWEANLLTRDLWILPLATAIADKDTARTCEQGKSIDISCQFMKGMVHDKVVQDTAKKAMANIARRLNQYQ